jgi:gamma-glutamyltranspeptidase / glutathione hydrolase
VNGVVAAGHPETAAAGAWALRQGGNAVDAAIAAMCASLAAESVLTGLGAGGYMLVHDPDGETALLDFFVSAPGLGEAERRVDVVPVEIDFGETVQVFNVGAASCGVPGVPAGIAAAAARWGSIPLAELVAPAVGLARRGVPVNRQQAYLLQILAPVTTLEPEGAAVYAPEGRPLREGELLRWPDLAEALELLGAEGSVPFYAGEVAARVSEWVCERGGSLARDDLAAYEPIEREPLAACFRGRSVLTNPPPSSGGILIAFALELLDRLGAWGPGELAEVMREAQASRTETFHDGLYSEQFARAFLGRDALDGAAARCEAAIGARRGGPEPGDRLGSTTHITAADGAGRCASVTCSNGTGSGLLVPGTGVHVNNMLGEEDLNPFGFHVTPPGRRMQSMMAPTAVLRDGRLEAALGSGGSNRIRSAITQAIVRMIGDGLDPQRAVDAPRIHFEDGTVQAEPGVDPEALAQLERRGYRVSRWPSRSLFFGGAHAIGRGPDGTLRGGGDPRRGGAVDGAPEPPSPI